MIVDFINQTNAKEISNAIIEEMNKLEEEEGYTYAKCVAFELIKELVNKYIE